MIQLASPYIDKLNKLGNNRMPFIFIFDFELSDPIILPINEAIQQGIEISFDKHEFNPSIPTSIQFSKQVIEKSTYLKAFNTVKQEIAKGNSYLLNLTFPTPINCNLSLKEIYTYAQAPYRLLFNNKFVVFSPEPFVFIKDNVIRTFPMKGTINANIPNARNILLNDEKEHAEHATIVDLLRNDMSRVAKNVTVERFKYIEHINNNQQNLLQMSSEISGDLTLNPTLIGSILAELLPAGSISGAPKAKTLEIIQNVEKSPRGYYTGIFGIFDGTSLKSAVSIRFIENTCNGLVYHSGGGITHLSNGDDEYNELIEKIYVPIF